MDNDKESEIFNLLSAKEYYLKRLDLISETPSSLDKMFMSITSTCIAIFGGLGFALVVLHNKDLSIVIGLLLSLIVSIIGIYSSSILLSLTLNTQKGHMRVQKDLDTILKILNKHESYKMIKLQDAVLTDMKDCFSDKFTNSQASDLLVNAIKLIRLLLIGYLAYTTFVSVLSIYCPGAIKILW